MDKISTCKKSEDAESGQDLADLRARLEQDPADFRLRKLYAAELCSEGFVEESIVEYKRLINLIPNDPEVFYDYGIALEKLNQLENAVKVYKKSIDVEPDFVDAHYNLAYALDRLGYIDAAVDEYYTTLELDPDDSNAHFNLGCLFSKCGDSEEAMRHLARSAELNPKDEYAFFYLAYEMQKKGQLDEAMELYKKVLDINPAYSWAHYNMGYIYLSIGKEQNAFNAFKLTYDLNPLDDNAFKKLVKTGFQCKAYDDLLDLLENKIMENPKNALAHFYIAEIYLVKKEYEDALYHYHKAQAFSALSNVKINLNHIDSRIQKLKKNIK